MNIKEARCVEGRVVHTCVYMYIYISVPVQGGMAEMSRRASARLVLLCALSQAPLRHWFVFMVPPALMSHPAGPRASGTFLF